MLLISGSSNQKLARDIAKYFKLPVYFPCSTFADGEVYVNLAVNVRREHVFIVQSTSKNVNLHLVELLLMVDAVKRACAESITIVVPYFGYARQDRRGRLRVPISSKLVSDILKTAGAGRVLTLDIHSDQQQGFFDGPWDNLFASFEFLKTIKNLNLKDMVVVSPDKGGFVRAANYAKNLGVANIAVVFKERDLNVKNKSKALNMIGDVNNKNCVVVDDMIDTGGSMVNAIELLKSRGAKGIYVFATHGVFSGDAVEKLDKSSVDRVFVSDSIEQNSKKLTKKIKVVSVSNLLAEAMERMESGESISEALLF